MPGFADDIGKLTPHLRRFARGLVRGHAPAAADDLVREAVLLASRADLPKRGPALAVWCYAALIRLNRLRTKAPLSEAGEHGGPLPFLPKDILRLDALPLECREVLLLTAVAGLAYGQAADALDVGTEQVFARLTRARDLLLRTEGAAGRPGRPGERGRQAAPTSHLRLVK